jgi:hypothetical protein
MVFIYRLKTAHTRVRGRVQKYRIIQNIYSKNEWMSELMCLWWMNEWMNVFVLWYCRLPLHLPYFDGVGQCAAACWHNLTLNDLKCVYFPTYLGVRFFCGCSRHYKAMLPVFFGGTSTENYGRLYSCTVIVAETASETSFISALHGS